MNIIHHLHYSNNQLNKYPNSLDIDFDWESNNLHANLENQFIFSSYNGKLGIGFDRYSLDTNYELSKSFYDIYNYYGSFNYNLTENLIQNIDAMILLSNRKHALKGTCITKWGLNRNNILKVITSYTERLFEEDNNLWYWSELGYGLIDTEYTIKGNFNKSKTFTTDIIWENKISEKLTIDISNYYRDKPKDEKEALFLANSIRSYMKTEKPPLLNSHFNMFKVGLLTKVFPNSKFILIIRDFQDYILQNLNLLFL